MMSVKVSPVGEREFLRQAIERSEKALAHAQFTLVAVATRLAGQRRELRDRDARQAALLKEEEAE